MKELLNIDYLYEATLSDSLSINQVNEIITLKDKFNWIGYAIVPVILLIKIGIVSAILWTGCFFFNKKISYKSLFTIVVKAEYIFLLVIIFKTTWFYFFHNNYSLEDIQYFYPLSVLNIIGYKGLEPWYIYPMQVLNLFECVYWGLLIYMLAKALNMKTDKAFNIVAGSYGAGLLIWVITIMFLTINFS
ncbi:MAG: hypothetical protein QM763_19035 [Agriterribacter sp.]